MKFPWFQRGLLAVVRNGISPGIFPLSLYKRKHADTRNFVLANPPQKHMLVLLYSLVQVGDWGLARSFHDNQRKHTPTVITLWYRPPEVLLRTTRVSQLHELCHYVHHTNVGRRCVTQLLCKGTASPLGSQYHLLS